MREESKIHGELHEEGKVVKMELRSILSSTNHNITETKFGVFPYPWREKEGTLTNLAVHVF